MRYRSPATAQTPLTATQILYGTEIRAPMSNRGCHSTPTKFRNFPDSWRAAPLTLIFAS